MPLFSKEERSFGRVSGGDAERAARVVERRVKEARENLVERTGSASRPRRPDPASGAP